MLEHNFSGRGVPSFQGGRLAEAREARGLSQVVLADLAGVSRQTISQYEGGRIVPHYVTLARLASLLNLPIGYFLRPVETSGFGPVFNRSMAAVTKRARTRGERRLEWLAMLVNYVRTYVDLPSADFPDLLRGRDPLALTGDDIEAAAQELRQHWGLGNNPISNVVWLLENKGAIVSRFDLEAETLDALSSWESEANRPFIILGLARGSSVRSRLDVAHELGHMVLHRGIADRDLRTAPYFKQLETQAFRFGGAFLFPATEFIRLLRRTSLDRMLYLKPTWKVSVSMQINRARDLGLIDELERRALYKARSARGWSTREPWDDVPLENPCLLPSSIQLLIQENVVAPGDIPEALTLNPADVETIGGLAERFFAQYGIQAPMSRPADGSAQNRPPAEILTFPKRQ